MTPNRFFEQYFRELSRRLEDTSSENLQALCEILSRSKGRKIIITGNGGSAAISSHIAVDLTKAAGLRAVTFNEPDLITCFGNDYGYENWITKAVDFHADAGDVGVFISSSGKSPNIVNGARRAAERGMVVVTLSGFDAANPLRSVGQLNLWVNSRNYNVVEATHQAWLVAVVDRLAAVEARP